MSYRKITLVTTALIAGLMLSAPLVSANPTNDPPYCDGGNNLPPRIDEIQLTPNKSKLVEEDQVYRRGQEVRVEAKVSDPDNQKSDLNVIGAVYWYEGPDSDPVLVRGPYNRSSFPARLTRPIFYVFNFTVTDPCGEKDREITGAVVLPWPLLLVP